MVRVKSHRSCERKLGENIISVLFINIFGGIIPKPAFKCFGYRTSFCQVRYFLCKQRLYRSNSHTCPFMTDENVPILAVETIAGLNQVTFKLRFKVTNKRMFLTLGGCDM
jgi:hypothetical protein